MASSSEKGPSAKEPFPDHEDLSDASSVLPDRNETSSPSLVGDDPPPYGDIWGRIGNGNSTTRADITEDGRVNIRIDQNTKGLSSLLVPALRSQLDLNHLKYDAQEDLTAPPPPYVPPTLDRTKDRVGPPALNIVIHVVGSRGDVQPFVALGKVLKLQHRHRVRIATHQVFQDLVEENGLEFFTIGGDPSELMAYMVKNPGLMPGFDALRSGDIGHRRHEIGNMLRGCWRSCFETGNGMGPQQAYADPSTWADSTGSAQPENAPKPFIADAIIANPPSFAHIHCAEKMGLPLHMMFTMPWSPTQAFPHPLANIQSTNAEGNMTNFMSYALVDMMTWQGLGDIINRFREKTLGLEPISLTRAPGMLSRARVPYTYCWSPALIPKPKDWGSYISISGFYFLSKSDDYTPEPQLEEFLNAGPPPVYIGFGSIVVDDPNAMTKLIFDTVKKSGQRALVSKGWGGFGAEDIGIPEGVYMIGNVPHDWLFKKVSCVVHHGGAGTTAAGIACGRPTVVVPFFGDQPFWGAMVARAGAGPAPVHSKTLTADALAEAIQEALRPETLEKAKELSERINQEKGCEVGAQSFHKQLEMDQMRCQLCPKRAASWRIRRTDVRLSAFAAAVLSHEKLLDFKDLKLYRSSEHEPDSGPVEPISGGASALIETMGSMAMGIADMPIATLKALKIHPDAKRERSNSNGGSPSARSRAASSASKRPSTPSGRNRTNVQSPPSTKTTFDSARSSRFGEHKRSASQSSRDTEAGGEQAAMAQQVGNALGAVTEGDQPDAQDGSQPLAEIPTRSSTGQASGKKQFNLDSSDWQNAMKTGQGAVQIATAAMKSPMDFTLGLAKGFHNAPKLWGDETVRKQEKITDLSTGLKVAGREMGYGFYDGISGLVTQPIEGAKKEGAAGFVKGFGKGLGGLVFKPGAGIWGLPGYTSMGIYREMLKRFGPSVEGYTIASRTAQGYAELRESHAEERASVIADWKEMRRFIHKRKNVGEEKMQEIQERIRKYTASSRDIANDAQSVTRQPIERTPTTGTVSSGVWSPDDSVARNPLSRATSTQGPKVTVNADGTLDDELEEAIRQSVEQTSQGDAQQDASIERAIRASLMELNAKAASGTEPHEARGHEGGEQVELEQALRESKEAHEQTEAERKQAEAEEEVVMRYVMKQSSLEEEAKTRVEKNEGGS